MTSRPPIGHNGPPVFESAEDLPSGLPKMHYFKCDIEALWNVLVEMPFELGGFYMRALLAMYKHMEGLPADDNVARMRLGGMDIRTYRRLKAALLAQPKCLIEKPSGRISNARFEEEVTAYVTEFKNRQRGRREREEKPATEVSKRTTPPPIPTTSGELQGGLSPKVQPTSGQLPANFRQASGSKFPEIPADVRAVFSKKANENKGGNPSIQDEVRPEVSLSSPPHARVLELELESVVKESTINHTVNGEDSARARALGPDEGSLHPKAVLAIETMAVVMGSDTDPDTDGAYRVVTKYAKAYDPQHVLDAALDFQAKRLDRSEPRTYSDRLFLDYIRQAERNATKSTQAPIVPVDKPPPRRVEPGAISDDILITDDHRIEMRNGRKENWLKQFGGDETALELALTQTMGRLRPNSPTPLAVQIEAALAGLALDTQQRSKNYTKVAQENAARREAAAPKPVEPAADRWARMRAAKHAQNGGN